MKDWHTIAITLIWAFACLMWFLAYHKERKRADRLDEIAFKLFVEVVILREELGKLIPQKHDEGEEWKKG